MGTRRIMQWPEVTGARTTEGWVCIGKSKRRSRSKFCRTFLRFIDPETDEVFEVLATQVAWAPYDRVTHAVLTAGIMELVNTKLEKAGSLGFDRATFATQIVDTTLCVYEAGYRGTLFPRFWWHMSNSCPPYSHGLREVLVMETLAPDDIVGNEDKRPCANVETQPDPRSYPLWMGDLTAFVDDALRLKELT